MVEIFEKYISSYVSLTEQEFQLIADLSAEKKTLKRQFVLKEGEISKNYFVAKGLLRQYRTDEKGNEHIFKFAHENRWINDGESYLTGEPGSTNIEAIEDSELLVWKKTDFDRILIEVPLFKQFMKTLSAKKQVANQTRLYHSMAHSAEEKYIQFMEHHSMISNRVPLHMIASYLGVSRETLSRIRRQSAGKYQE